MFSGRKKCVVVIKPIATAYIKVYIKRGGFVAAKKGASEEKLAIF
jgi:hypothetical protein